MSTESQRKEPPVCAPLRSQHNAGQIFNWGEVNTKMGEEMKLCTQLGITRKRL